MGTGRGHDSDGDVGDVRIEVELDDTPSLEHGRRRTTEPGGTAAREDDQLTLAERLRPHRTALAAIGVAAIAVVAFTLGRTTGDAGTAATATSTPPDTTAAAAPTTTERPTTRPRTSTTVRATTTTQPLVEITEHGGPFLPSATGATLVGLTTDGDLLTVDLDGGRIVRTDLQLAGTAEGNLTVAGDAALISLWDGSTPRIVRGAAPVERFFTAVDQTAYPGPTPDSLWVAEYGPTTALNLVSTEDRRLGTRIELAGGYPMLGDGRGGVLFRASGGTYLAPDLVRVTPGDVLAVGINHFVVKECDERLACAVDLVDRTTGARQPLSGWSSDSMFQIGNGTLTVSPDGAWIAVMDPQDEPGQVSLLHVPDGGVVDLPPSTWDPSVSWTDDSRYVLLNTERGPAAYDTATGGFIDLSPEIGRVSQFRLRTTT